VRWVIAVKMFLLFAAVAVLLTTDLWLWSLPARLLAVLSLGEQSQQQAFSPDSRSLAIAEGEQGPVALWDVPSGCRRAVLAQERSESQWRLNFFTFAPNGRFLAANYLHREVQFWNVAAGRTHSVFSSGDNDRLGFLCFSPQADAVVLDRFDKPSVSLQDTRTGRDTASLETEWPVGFSQDGAMVVGRYFDRSRGRYGVGFWSSRTGRLVRVLLDPSGDVQVVTLAQDGTRAAATVGPAAAQEARRVDEGQPAPHQIVVWDVNSATELARFPTAPLIQGVLNFGFASDRSFLAVWQPRKHSVNVPQVGLWDVDAHPPRQLLPSRDIHFLPLGGRFLVLDRWDDEREIELWELRPLRRIAAVRLPRVSHRGLERFPECSPDGTYLTMTADFEEMSVLRWLRLHMPALNRWQRPMSETRFYAVTTGAMACRFPGCQEGLFSPDGKIFAAVNENNTVTLWEMPPRKPVVESTVLLLLTLLPTLVVGRRYYIRRHGVARKM
jgi:WD40 repeat protein